MLRLRGGCAPSHTEGEIHILYVTLLLRQRLFTLKATVAIKYKPFKGVTISYNLSLKTFLKCFHEVTSVEWLKKKFFYWSSDETPYS